MGHFYRPDFFLERLWLPMFWGNRKHPKFCSNLQPDSALLAEFQSYNLLLEISMRFLSTSSGPRHVPHHTYCVRAPRKEVWTSGVWDIGHVGLDSPAKGAVFFVFCMVFFGPGHFGEGLTWYFFGTCKLY